MIARASSVPGFHPPRQERSRATVDRIVVATEDLLAEHGPQGVTVHAIVERADSSIGSFYARFDDREAAVRYVQDRFWNEAERRWLDYLDPVRWEGRTVLEIVARVIRQFARMMTADGNRIRPFLLQALSESRGNLLDRTAALDRAIARQMAALLRTAERLPSDPPEWILREGFVRVLGAIRDAVILGDDSEPAVRRLVLSLVRMYTGALDIEGAPDSWPGLLDLCVERPDTTVVLARRPRTRGR